eukprot:TRINITY_DN122270_c0_g1_i1.p1 TRINITY_DN122270_c0_g1~~TRINITY_DN122270_c0_g1_i1.p1  ORF type:complete len:1412 (-),score=210.43 TRINITY_DN122270_c0_g1_i1:188-4423(-)
MADGTGDAVRRIQKSTTAALDFDLLKDDLVRYADDPVYNGLFIDFLVRQRSSLRAGSTAKGLLDHHSGTKHVYTPFPEGIGVVKREKLTAKIREIITRYYKARGDPAFRNRTREELVRHLFNIKEHMRKAKQLTREVDNFGLVEMIRTGARELELHETAEERRQRLEGFWQKYHANHRVAHVQLAMRPNTPDEEPEDPGILPVPLVWSCDAWKKRNCFSKRQAILGNPAGSLRPGYKKADVRRMPPVSLDPIDSTPHKSATAWDLSRELGRKRNDKQADDRSRHPTTDMAPLRSVKNRAYGSEVRSMTDSAPKFGGGTAMGEADNRLRASSASAPGIRGNEVTMRSSQKPQVSKSSSTPSLPSMNPFDSMAGEGCKTPSSPFLLVPEKHLTKMPYSRWGGVRAVKSATSPSSVYVNACDESFVLPSLMSFCTGDSAKLLGQGQALSDPNLMAVTKMLQHVPAVQEVNLQGNAMLSERSLVPFLQQLKGRSAESLDSLSLRDCLRQATSPGVQEVLDSIVDVLSNSIQRLRILDLSGIPMGLKSHLPLCEAIRDHATVQSVCLAEVGLGRNLQCLETLLGGNTITSLDLSWNSFSNRGFELLGELLVGSQMVKTLKVANCSASSEKGTNPVEFFLEQLCMDKVLTNLDVSLNRIDFNGALVLENALERHSKLSEINIAHNPLSVLGFRCLLRLLAQETSGLTLFHCESCSSGNIMEAADSGFQVYSATNPGGRYPNVNLSRPYDRALLCMLYKVCARFDFPQDQAFVIHQSNPPYKQHPARDGNGLFQVPREGKLDVTFDMEALLTKSMRNLPEDDFALFLAKHYESVRVTTPRRKTIPLYAQWKRIAGLQVEQLTMLDALSKDFYFDYSLFAQACRSRELIGQIALRLLPCLHGDHMTRFLSLQLMPSLGEYLKLMVSANTFLVLNVDNPTGHYNLDLSNCCDYAVAERLLLLDRWECGVAARKQLANSSMRGVRSQFRNELYQDRPLPFDVRSIAEFNLPEYGTLEFDYVSNKRPPVGTKPISDETFDQILLAIQHADTTAKFIIEAVTMSAHYFYVSCLQMRGLTGLFKKSSVRAEIFVRLFLRITDMWNEKIFRSRFEDAEEFQRLQLRLGHTTFFTFIQPEQQTFRFDFEIFDQRLGAQILLGICNKEAKDNLKNPQYTPEDGVTETFEGGIPQAWLTTLPTKGVLRARYGCAPEDRNYAERARLMELYGYWVAPSDKEEVMWWSSIADAPEEVIDFVEFLFTKYNDIWKPWQLVNQGKAEIDLKTFEEGVDSIECKKFDGRGKKERLLKVFRYLDPSGEGMVSEGEWGALKQIFNEIQLSISDFVDFCVRTFGPNLMDAWNALVPEGREEIDPKQWRSSLTRLGFFGPADPIFAFMDLDDEGTVSLDEFEYLEPLYKAKRKRKQGL